MKPNERIEQKVKKLPLLPGVYLMKNKEGTIIYVGKAKALKNRVSQYFINSAAHTPKVRRMVANIDDFDYIVVGSEYDALVLECNLIKLHRPRYNILLKDDKQYPFIRVSMNEPWPRITFARKKKEDGARYFGPFVSAGAVRETISEIQKIFLIPSCRKVFPRDIGKERPCLNYHIKRCFAPCRGEMTQGEYYAVFEEIVRFLNGDYDGVVGTLQEQMERAAEELNFEYATRCRDKIRAIEKIGQRQQVYNEKGDVSRDVVGYFEDGFRICFTVLSYRYGKLIDKEDHLFSVDDIGQAKEAFSEFVLRYYGEKKELPRQIYLQERIDDQELLGQMLAERAGHKIELRVPQRGEGVDLVEMAQANAREKISQTVSREEKNRRLLVEVQQALSLPTLPKRIEAYDISNTGSADISGGMVVFENGIKAPKQYRTFHVKQIEEPDDYAATKEVIYRRLERAMGGDERFLPLPDLILLDGGKGHLNAVHTMFEGLDIHIPLFGMVKDRRHRIRGLVSLTGEMNFAPTSPLFLFFGRISEEVHRFAITFHKKRRSKSAVKSVLEEIPGVGPARRAALLRGLGSVEAIQNAAEEELKAVPGMNAAAARAVYAHFHEGEEEPCE